MRPLFLYSSILFLGLPLIASAQIEITEIMYDPPGSDTGREWVEVFNSSNELVTIIGGSTKASWRLVEESSSGSISRRTFSFADGGSSISVPARSFAVIANDPGEFLSDHPDFTGILMTAKISLTNAEGKRLVLTDESGRERSVAVTYLSLPEASNTGASLQLQSDGSWIPGLPTPGEENTNVRFELPEKETKTASSSKDEFSNLDSSWPFTDEVIYVKAGENKRVFVGEEVRFNGEARLKNKEEPKRVRYSWAFGDGRGDDGRDVTYVYKKPGVYSVVLTVESEGKTFKDRVKIQVLETEVIKLGEVSSGFVEVINSTEHEVELSNWEIDSGDKQMKLATGTHILPKSSMFVPFEKGVSSAVRLLDGQGRAVGEVITVQSSAILPRDSYVELIERLTELLEQARVKNKRG